MANVIEEISELTQLVEDAKPEDAPDNSPLTHSKIAFVGGILVIDAVTSYTVWMITTYWYYGVIWFLVGAIAFFLHQRNWERSGNNDKQEKGAMIGMGVAVGAMLVVGTYSAIVFVMKTYTPFSEALIVGSSVILFFFHIYELGFYYFSDDDWITKRAIANAEAHSAKKIKIIKAADRVVSATKTTRDMRNASYTKHGDKGAVDAAINRVSGNKPQGQSIQATRAPAMAEQGEPLPKLEEHEARPETNPTKGR
jgi:hypothetical protein